MFFKPIGNNLLNNLYLYFSFIGILEVLIISPCNASYIIQHGIKSWPIWECEPSIFNWQYNEKEVCLLLEGEATVDSLENNIFKIKAGDLVIFPKGFKCTWNISKTIKKHYRVGD